MDWFGDLTTASLFYDVILNILNILFYLASRMWAKTELVEGGFSFIF